MAQDHDSIRIRPGRVRDRGVSRPVRHHPATFMGEVHQAIRRAGGDPNRLPGRGKRSGRFNASGRGAKVAAGLKGRNGWSRSLTGERTRSRRVAVKARIVKLNPQRGGRRGRQFVSAKAVDAHLRYLERDGMTRDDEKGQVYSAGRDVEDGRAFLERGREDRHQFRFIVSAEDGVELSDLRETTRDLMQQMEADLDTKLDWIAVDHHNTGHPHTHVLLRGVTDQGKALNIAGDYIAHGIRERASEIVTRELGRQAEQEVSQQLQSEVHAERFTRLDRMLIAEQEARSEFADLRPDKDMRVLFRKNRALLIDRARHLERMGLATEVTPGRWTIAPEAEGTLRELGTRNDIIKTMQRALNEAGLAEPRRGARYVMHGAELAEPVTGRVLSKGLGSDELGERLHLVIDGVDGRIHHMEVGASRTEEIGRGVIVEATPPPRTPRAADRNILAVTGADGVYSPSEHLEVARVQAKDLRTDPEMFVKAHVRRLEALRRAGIVERIHAEHWTIPADLPERGLAHDLKRDGRDARLKLLSPIPLSQQVTHDGATWLDRELTARRPLSVAAHGFGREVNDALDRRAQRLVDMGYATAKDGYINIPHKTVAVLERQEVERIGKARAAERGRVWEPAQTGNYVAGTLVGSTQLASGRFAMIDDGLGFSLVPWSQPLEKQLGKHITGIAMSSGGVDWDFGRQRGLGL
ncbi:DUF3363 domain-containing protein [Algihabitans albus]|uniref:DUF3363 domain-containing protein n=1 Tax=Algihabitans albus TaxID=2164067 RepID=UPI000E5CB705|nr:DUF3363 domain-containing protein [Algihabitans albus]